MNVYFYFLRILYSYFFFRSSPINILISCRYYPNRNYIRFLFKIYTSNIFTNLLNAMKYPGFAYRSSLFSPLLLPRRENERKERESTNWRRCAVNVLNDGILITRHVMGAIKQLAAVSISPMHQEASAYAHVATNSPVGAPRLSKRRNDLSWISAR